ncbi:hypothetical protein PtA15_9A543 [Puccinia triticina]|uniref:Uncharacterized protein n=1 Tax=Puccinia triticina TaxID=208348 RepID=A0ABY7CT15_9BASI|nr:uncharacterized protein PtA15_9A543 [Puccinia triticina]WAQ88416.1 hypothetical protein PtA15_9A543 [Puccinia triticina]
MQTSSHDHTPLKVLPRASSKDRCPTNQQQSTSRNHGSDHSNTPSPLTYVQPNQYRLTLCSFPPSQPDPSSLTSALAASPQDHLPPASLQPNQGKNFFVMLIRHGPCATYAPRAT